MTRRYISYIRPARRAFWALLWATALTATACDNDVNFNPTVPTAFPRSGSVGLTRILNIAGSLTAEDGSIMEATILYDGEELPDARSQCPEVQGCRNLELTAVARSAAGHHTISFLVVSQSPDAVDYLAGCTIRITGEGLGFMATLPLKPTRATLRSGESLNFELDLID